jgi:hypothetical protein
MDLYSAGRCNYVRWQRTQSIFVEKLQELSTVLTLRSTHSRHSNGTSPAYESRFVPIRHNCATLLHVSFSRLYQTPRTCYTFVWTGVIISCSKTLIPAWCIRVDRQCKLMDRCLQLMCLEMRRWVYSVLSSIQWRGWHVHEIYLHNLLLSYILFTATLRKELRNANVCFQNWMYSLPSKFTHLKIVSKSFLQLHKHQYVIKLLVLLITSLSSKLTPYSFVGGTDIPEQYNVSTITYRTIGGHNNINIRSSKKLQTRIWQGKFET